MQALQQSDPEIFKAIQQEVSRQNSNIELIASENFTSAAILEAAGSLLTNKYAEGYPNARYYGGCEAVDQVEILAQERAKALFGAEYANVQPHSGTQANIAVYLALLKPGDKILTMSLQDGGHLTHGYAKNISGMLYQVVHYGVNPQTGYLDYDQLEALALKERPKMITVGASAYSRALDFERFAKIAQKSGALLMADMAHIAGLVATGLHTSPVPFADVVTSTTHKTLRGPRGGLILCKGKYAKAIDSALFPGSQGGPLMHIIAAKAVCFLEASRPEFRNYIERVLKNGKFFANSLADKGFSIVSGGTDNHLFMIDLRPSHPNLTGLDAQKALDQVHITVNRNTVPGETRSPYQSSGLRIGTAAITTRGMGEKEITVIAGAISSVLSQKSTESQLKELAGQLKQLAGQFPLPGA